MTGFLARVAARAVGEAAPARPRVGDPFDRPEVDATAMPPAVAVEPRRPARRPDPPRTLRREAVPPGAGLPTRQVAAALGPPTPEAPDRRAPSEPSQQAPSLVTAVSAERPAEPGPASPRDEMSLARATPVVSAPMPRSATASAAVPDEQPAVRVHIGRLEVRATLEQPPAPTRRRPESRSPELTLSDYLRGRPAR